MSKYTKDSPKKKSRIEIFYKANIKSEHKTDKLKKGIFFIVTSCSSQCKSVPIMPQYQQA